MFSAAVSHDSQWVVSGSFDQCVQFWDLRTGQAHLLLHGHNDSGERLRECGATLTRTGSGLY